jgi:NADPH2:quinone reductase
MLAVWYERNGPARDVLSFGELADPEPAPAEVRVRIHAAGVNPADVKRRAGIGGRVISHPRVIPGDDGAGVIDLVGAGVDADRVGQRVWVRFANQNSPFGSSAERVTVPAQHAVVLPQSAPFEAGACLGVPALTAHRAVFADGPVDGATILVAGAAGAVGSYAVQFARLAGACVIALASTPEKQAASRCAGAEHVLDYREPDTAQRIHELTDGNGVDRVIDVAFGANLHLTSRVVAENGMIVAYGSDQHPVPQVPFYPLMRRGVTIRLVSVFSMPTDALHAATDAVTELLAAGALRHRIVARLPLHEAARAHTLVEGGRAIGKTLLQMP